MMPSLNEGRRGTRAASGAGGRSRAGSRGGGPTVLPGAGGARGGGGYCVTQVGQVQALELGQAAQGVGGQGGLVGLATIGNRGEDRRVGLGHDEVGRGGRGGVPERLRV